MSVFTIHSFTQLIITLWQEGNETDTLARPRQNSDLRLVSEMNEQTGGFQHGKRLRAIGARNPFVRQPNGLKEPFSNDAAAATNTDTPTAG